MWKKIIEPNLLQTELEKGMTCLPIYVDLKKAFDPVRHCEWIEKASKTKAERKMTDNLLYFIQQYVSNIF